MLQKLNFDFENSRLVKDGALTIAEEDGYTLMMTVPNHEMWKVVHSGEKSEPLCAFFIKEVEPGIYLTGLNFEHDIDDLTEFKAVGSYDRIGKDGLTKQYDPTKPMGDFFENTMECYGIADNVEQIKERYKEQISADAPIVITMTEINKKNEPEDGGWRWSKWGKYIGTRKPQCEYIYDEPEIDSVYVFHVYSVVPKAELVTDNKHGKKIKM